MGSVANTDVTLPDAVVPKRELSIDDYGSDTPSTPDEIETIGDGSEQANQEPVAAPKRKGGRKPVCMLLPICGSRCSCMLDLCHIRGA